MPGNDAVVELAQGSDKKMKNTQFLNLFFR